MGDRSNGRIQVFDNDLKFKAIYDQVGAPWALCISPGPHQYLYQLEFEPGQQQLADHGGHRRDLQDGARRHDSRASSGTPGKKLGEFSTVHEIDCRNPDELLVSEITAWRVQKLILQSAARRSRGGSREARRGAAVGAAAACSLAQPEIAYDSAPDLLKLPDGITSAKSPGVATNSKGNIFVYTRTGGGNATIGGSRVFTHGGSRLFEFDREGQVSCGRSARASTAFCSPSPCA